MYDVKEPMPETTFSTHGTPVLGPLPESVVGSGTADHGTGLRAELMKGPPIVAANLADSTPIGFAVYVVVLALVFYALNIWINVLGQMVGHFNKNLAMANWQQLPGPQLTLFALSFTLGIKYIVDVVRSYNNDVVETASAAV